MTRGGSTVAPDPGEESLTTAARALVWHGGDRFEIREVPVPELGPGDLLVRVTTAAICGSDRHSVSGRRSAPAPSVLGHEGVGTIEAIGAEASPGARSPSADCAVGDRIVWSVVSHCGACDRCRAGRTAKCRQVRKVGHESLTSGWPLSGCYASHILLPAGHDVVRVPDAIADGPAAISACAGATVTAVIEAAQGGPAGSHLAGARVVVSGLGMLGLLAMIAALDAGAREVIGVDPSAERRDLARRAGAHEVHESTVGVTPVDAVLELSGADAAVAGALELLDVGGVLVLAGSVSPGPGITMDPERMVRGHHRVVGVHNYEARHLAEAVALLGTERAAVLSDPTVLSTPISLVDVPAAFATAPRSLRTLIALEGT